MSNTTIIRPAQRPDSAGILNLMVKLAEFEGYINQFRITQLTLVERLFITKDIHVLVAERNDQVIGILVYYFLPFTYDNSPWMYIKELYVEKDYRSENVGKMLMQQLAKVANQKGTTKIRWDVLATNNKAKSFYRSIGAQAEANWELYSLNTESIHHLASNLEPLVD